MAKNDAAGTGRRLRRFFKWRDLAYIFIKGETMSKLYPVRKELSEFVDVRDRIHAGL